MVPERKVLIELRFGKQMTREAIAEYFSVNVATVRRWIKDLDVPRPTRRKTIPRAPHLTSSGEIVSPITNDEAYTSIENARIILEGRLIVRHGYGYYLDGRPAHIDVVLDAAKDAMLRQKSETVPQSELDSHFS
jgi:hypothetical protein